MNTQLEEEQSIEIEQLIDEIKQLEATIVSLKFVNGILNDRIGELLNEPRQ